ncbi:hypothetical protein RO3G_06786 [Rhizopus delemar RA 99-880]|uniref:Uncharacterized protein n=1 Tax=Rhizopus delemar (strain RA 99-880 / ATCC MYA-4621 / FGSC 9543 / NRRL 43880) TaxID=246409 RepID=I1C0V1_RHIO9|nr:hypothetical protein RO3G_06786 [Rhizopus delemar RA 99-880]|eukprot:EIE82081.1 hypothetical protein RO3G_06786 [Rhizopus delemar RA 99-880]
MYKSVCNNEGEFVLGNWHVVVRFFKGAHVIIIGKEYVERVFDSMEGELTEISDTNVILETITSQKSYLSLKPAGKETTTKDSTKKATEVVKKAATTKTTTTKLERHLLTE